MVKEKVFISKSPARTITLAKRLARFLPPGSVVILDGDLGGGKTTFVKGVTQALAPGHEARSPTFPLIREYGKVVHVDLWRLSADEVEDLDLKEYCGGEHILLVEWGSKAGELFAREKGPVVYLRFEIVGANTRRITITYPDTPVALRRTIERLLCG